MTQNRVLPFRLVDRFESLSPAECPDCAQPLGFHQPDPRLPFRLLATCSHCKSWYLIDLARELLFRLPGIVEHLGENEGSNQPVECE